MTNTQNEDSEVQPIAVEESAKETVKQWGRELLRRRAVLIASLIFIAMYLYSMIQEYLRQTQRLDEAALHNFNLAPSSEFTFFQVLRLAQYPYLEAAVIRIIAVFIPSLLMCWLVDRCIVMERHPGWKRLAIGLIVLAVAYQGITAHTFGGFIITSLLTSTALLISLLLIRWIIGGFGGEVSES